MSTAKSIFISYRRDDTKHITGRIYDHLEREFGDAVFKDVDSIPLGIDFRKYIDQQVSQCQICIAVIGARWLSVADESGQRRLDNPSDFVRLEIETVLKRDIPVIPVLVDGSRMPSEAELPESLKELAFRNAAEIQPDPNFRRDVQRLIKGIQAHFKSLEQTPSTSTTEAPTPPQSFPPAAQTEPPPTPQKPPQPKDEFANLPALYQPLKDHLANGRWQEADQETFKVMLAVAGQTQQGCLNKEDIEKFPCEDLRIIDQLWVKFSDGRFGFSVQKKIYIETGNKLDGNYYEKEYRKFGEALGWRVSGVWLNYSDITFDPSAPLGHLPRVSRSIFRFGFPWLSEDLAVATFAVSVFPDCSLASRLVKCSIG